MKLKRNEEVQLIEAIVIGSIDSFMDNEPLAKMLEIIQESGMNSFLIDETLKNFAKCLVHSFEKEGYLSDKTLTENAKEIIKTKKSWRSLKGQFKVTVVVRDTQCYLVDLIPYFNGDVSGYSVEQSKIIFAGQYQNNYGMKVKNVQFENTWYKNPKNVELLSCYDYENDKDRYELNYGDKTYRFNENQKTFKLVDNYKAIDLLRHEMSNYQGFTVEKKEVILNSYENENELFLNAIKDLFNNRGFFTSKSSECTVEDIRVSIKERHVAEKVLIEFLLNKAEEKYCSYSEISVLISEFYDFFNDCADIRAKSVTVYDKLLEVSADKNPTAHMRLLAYQDIVPHLEKYKYKYKLDIKDFSNREMAMNDVVKEMFGEAGGIVSITMLTKYAYKNAKISRGIRMMADVVRKKYRIPLTLITAKDENYIQADVAKEFFNEIEASDNMEWKLKDKKDIKRIHDRYYRIERENGQVEWLKMSGELDALRYENDFSDGKTPNKFIDENTIARVKEMTIVYVDEDGIGSDIKKIMED